MIHGICKKNKFSVQSDTYDILSDIDNLYTKEFLLLGFHFIICALLLMSIMDDILPVNVSKDFNEEYFPDIEL